MEGCSDFDKEELGLISVNVGTFRGLVFANLDSDAEDLCSYLGNAEGLANEMDIHVSNLNHAATYTYDIDADWKLFAENSLECYHCPLVHQDTFASYVGTLPKDYITREFENVLSQVAPITRAPGVDDTSKLKGFRLLYIWPSTFISEDDFVAIVARITATGAQRTRFTVDAFVKPDVDPEAVAQWLDVYDRTFQEDKEVVLAQQTGYNSGTVPQGRLMVNREASIKMFQRRTWDALGQDPRVFGQQQSSAAATTSLKSIPVTVLPTPARASGAERTKQFWEGDLNVATVESVADGVALVSLVSREGETLPAWQPGAHIDLILPNGLERQYSLCGDVSEKGRWQIGVLREPNSRGGSSFVHDGLLDHGCVKVRGPRNHFKMPDARHYRFVAGGIGITPILAMIRQAEATGKEWSLLYGGRTRSSMAFLDELQGYGGRVRIQPQDQYGLLDLNGYLADAPEGTAVCACGPQPLLDALTTVCDALPQIQLHVEHFTAVPVDRSRDTEFEVELRKSNRTVTVPKDQSLLQVVRQAGVQVYSSCETGVCGTCETAVLDGDPDHRDMVLSEDEKAAGLSMMICVSRCKSNKLVLDL
jgi:ferredoxin-NADP reductase